MAGRRCTTSASGGGRRPIKSVRTPLWQARIPRVYLALAVGAALGCAGAVLQGVFANPPPSPASSVSHQEQRPVRPGDRRRRAGCGGLPLWVGLRRRSGDHVVSVFTWRRGRRDAHPGGQPILTGIAVNAFAGGLIVFFPTARLRPRDQIVFWQMGSLNRATMMDQGAAGRRAGGDRPGGIAAAGPPDRPVVAGEYTADTSASTSKAAADVGGHRRAADGRGGQLLRNHPVRRSGGAALHAAHRRTAPPGLDPGERPGRCGLLTAADLAARTLVPYGELPIGMVTSPSVVRSSAAVAPRDEAWSWL